MIVTFRGYPDELLYSIIGRYRDYTQYPRQKSVLQDFFDTLNVKAVVDLPCRLDVLIKALPKGHQYTSLKIINDHTLLPFYAPFLPLKRYEYIVRQMQGGNDSQNLHLKLGSVAARISRPQYLRYCQACYQSDMREHGVGYWHRVHQVPGVFLCPHHNSMLIQTNISTEAPHQFTSLEKYVVSAPPQFSDPNAERIYEHPTFMSIAKNALWLLAHSCAPLLDEAINAKYSRLLFKRGLATYRGTIRTQLLVESFKRHFPDDVLVRLDASVTDRHKRNWVSRIAQEGQTQPTLRHLILLSMFDVKISDFMQIEVTQSPFGNGPWPCLNPVCEHYQSSTIASVLKGYSRRKGELPIGTFVCPHCGFTYSRIGPDNEAAERSTYTQVLDYGELWKQKLTQLRNSGGTWKDTAQALGTTYDVVRLQADKIAQDGSKVLNEWEHLPELRNQWLDVQKESPHLSLAKLIEEYPRLHHALYRYDADWLDAHKPNVDKSKGRGEAQRIDWVQRDLEYLKRLQSAHRELLLRDEKPIRITVASLARQSNLHDGVLYRKRDSRKLPKCMSFIEEVSETHEDFAIRRIQWVSQTLIAQEELPCTPSSIIKAAGVSKAMQTERVIEVINQVLDECSSSDA